MSATPQTQEPAEYAQATYQDVLDAPAHQVAEIVDGTLHTHPRPASPHALASLRLGIEIGGPFDRGRGGPGGWWILDEPELHLGDDILVPDLAGWRRGRMPEYPDTAYFTLAPDWVVEIRGRLNRALAGAYTAPGAIAFNYPTIRSLAGHLLAELGHPAPERATARPADDPDEAHVEGLSAEVAAELGERP